MQVSGGFVIGFISLPRSPVKRTCIGFAGKKPSFFLLSSKSTIAEPKI